MTGLLRRILDSGYAIVAVGTAGFLIVLSLQFAVETNRREAFDTLNNAQNAQSALGMLSKEIWELRAWDNAPTFEFNAAQKIRTEVHQRIDTHQAALIRYTGDLSGDRDAELLARQIGEYIKLSNDSNLLWEKLGRWSDDLSRNGLTGALISTEKALAATTPTSSLYRSLREAQLEAYQILMDGRGRNREMPDGKRLADLSARVLRELPKARLPSNIAADLATAMESLVREDYIAQQTALATAIQARNASFQVLEDDVRGLSLKLVGQQRDALAGFERARSQSLGIVTVGSLLLGLLFVSAGVTSTRNMRKQSQLLQLSERRFKDFASASSDTLIELNPEHKITAVYRTSNALNDDAEEALKGQTFFAPRAGGEQSRLLSILATRESFRGYEAQLPARDDLHAWRRINGVPFYDENQNFAGYRLSIINMAEQKALELELRAKQAVYEQLVDQVPGAVYVMRTSLESGKRTLEYTSASFTALTGYTLDEANMAFAMRTSIVQLDVRDPALPKKESLELKATVRRSDGTLIPVLYSRRRIDPAPNGDLRDLGILVNMSALEAAEQTVRERERQLTSILSNIGSAYFFSVVMGDGKIEPQFCSAGVEAVLGYSIQEWSDLFRSGAKGFALTAPPDDRARIESAFHDMSLGKDPAQWEFQTINRRLRKDGKIINCMTRGRHIRMADGRLLQEGMVIDVTADMQRQEELIRLKAAVDGASDSIAVWTRDDRIPGGSRNLIYANKVAQTLLSRAATPQTPAADNDDKWQSVRNAAEPDLSLEDIDAAVEKVGRWNGQKLIACNDGASIVADITVTRINDKTDLHVVRDVTELKALELATEKARNELQGVLSAMDFAGEGICITDGTKIILANKSFATMNGFDGPSLVVGLTFDDIVAESEPPMNDIVAETRAVLASGKPYAAEATMVLRASGQQKVLRWSTAPLSDGRWINISRDVTEKRSFERKRMKLDRSVADIASRRDLSRLSPRDVYEIILQEISKTMSVKRVSIWRLTSDRAALQSVLAVHDGQVNTSFVTFERADREEYFEELTKLRSIVIDDVLSHPITASLRESYYVPCGVSSTLDVPILWQGMLWGVICIENFGPKRVWDVAEVTYATYMADFIVMTLERLGRDEAQARIEFLYQENMSILSALDSTQERIIIEDAGGYVRYVNQAVADAWGHGSKDELLGRPFLAAFPLLQTYRRSMENEVLASISRTGAWSGELLLARPAGDNAYVDIRVMELPDKGLLYTAEDVTEQRKHEQREQQLKTQLIEAQKMESIGRLAGGVAHDFNNIVAAVRAFASLVSSEVQPGTKARTYADRIINTCDRAADLVRQILLFSRASRAELKATSMAEVMEEVTAYLRASIPASITVDIQQPEKDAVVLGNAGQLVQVVMNLGLNARDAIGERPGRIQIFSDERMLSDREVADYKPGLSITNTARNDGVIVHQYVVGAPLTEQRYLCLTVRDDGPGMSGITVERMFEPFFTTKEKARGTGLGLPVVAAVVAAHAGFTVVTTQQGRGCRFNVYLPMSRHGLDKTDAPMRPAMERLMGTERVLLVDDEADLADATSLLLRKYGYDVAPLYFPRDALRVFEADPDAWDIVITDQVMPSMKGLELIANLRKVRPDIPVILCTGFSDFATERNAKALGADAFFTKPVLPEVLAQAIRQLRDVKINAQGQA